MPETDDLAQEVFCRLLANRRRALRNCRAGCEAELMGYLARVCNSVLVSAARERGALKRQAALTASWNELDEDEVPAPGLDPEERAMMSDALRKARTCTTDVCPVDSRRERFILDQVLFVGYTSGELSRSIGLSVSAIDALVSRARRRAASRGIPFPRRGTHAGAGARGASSSVDRCRSAGAKGGRGRPPRGQRMPSTGCGCGPVTHG